METSRSVRDSPSLPTSRPPALPAPAAQTWDARMWAILIVLCGALFLDAPDVSMVGVALPSIRTSLGLTTSSLQWIVSAYVLGYGGPLLLGGPAAHPPRPRPGFPAPPAPFPPPSPSSLPPP